ncbi:MAG: hypothetical protein ACI9G1_005235 [Pirellulaceae bacterium]|jgi:hypothetical protein
MSLRYGSLGLVVVVLLMLFPQATNAQVFGRRSYSSPSYKQTLPSYGPHNGNTRHYHATPAFHGNHYNYNSWKDYSNEYYPKYYGAFHARTFYGDGFPNGDLGLRGTPW